MTATQPVLVTGATGFIGAHLVRELTGRGLDVRATKRPTSDTSPLADTDVEWVTADVLDAASVEAATRGCGSVVHLAGIGLDAGPPARVREVNVAGTRNVLTAADSAGVERVLYASTAGTRRSEGVADETDLARPLGPYQEAKREAERLAHSYDEAGLDVVTVHPTSVFGPGDRAFTGRLLRMATDPKLFASLPGGVSFVGVTDVAAGIAAALDSGTPGEHYILGGQNLTFAAALERIAETAGGSPPVVDVPAPVVHALGHVAEASDEYLGMRFFPFTADMARLATTELFYSSAKASRELGYDYRPLRAHVPAAMAWFDGTE